MAKVFKSYREESRDEYGQTVEKNENLCLDQLKVGALLRIADAAEKIARSYSSCKRLAKRISTLEDVITKLKKER